MGKQKAPRRVGDNEALAVGTTIRGSAQKLNLVAALIRGRKAEDALNILTFSKKAMARDASKVLASAIANAENNHNLDVDALVVAEASVGTQIRGSAQKLNLVAGLIRGKKAGDAMNILQFSTKGMAVDARKVLASAIANAENNHNLDVDALVVAEASVGKSITMKRFATRGRGKSTRILKPFSRLRIVVREQEEA